MKPVDFIPYKAKYGGIGGQRFIEIQRFVAAKCKYAEVDMYTRSSADEQKKASVEKQGYEKVLEAHDFGANIKCYSRNGKVYLENLDIQEGEIV